TWVNPVIDLPAYSGLSTATGLTTKNNSWATFNPPAISSGYVPYSVDASIYETATAHTSMDDGYIHYSGGWNTAGTNIGATSGWTYEDAALPGLPEIPGFGWIKNDSRLGLLCPLCGVNYVSETNAVTSVAGSPLASPDLPPVVNTTPAAVLTVLTPYKIASNYPGDNYFMQAVAGWGKPAGLGANPGNAANMFFGQQYSNSYCSSDTDGINSSFTGSISGTTLTVTGTVAGTIAVSTTPLDGRGGSITPGTYIAAEGTGTGGDGTYTVNNSQSVSATVMTQGHAQSRFCLRGSSNANGPGVEWDTWNGSLWSPAFSATSSGIAGSSLRTQGAMTGATINGEFTVDGLGYPTLNAAWSAAVNQANTTGQNQTVRLGPGTFPVTATLAEPSNGACVSVLGSAGTTVNADSTQIATTLTVPSALNGDVFSLGNTAQAQGCTFRDLNVLAGGNATHGFELQWFRGVLIDNVTVNDTAAEGILLGEENTSAGHQANFTVRNVTVSYSSAAFTPANRPAYGIHLQKTAMDSYLDNVIVRNALTAAVYNEGTGNTGYLIHGFGYPYTCSAAPCANNASSSSASNASYATSYVIYDTGGSGSVWTDTYADSPAVAGFYVGANGIEIHGGHIQWPDLTSFPAANLATVASSVSNNLLIADVDCLEMASGVNWITYAGSSGNPPTYASVHHLTGCGNYYQALEDAEVTGFSSGGANINDPSSATPRVWSTPIAAGSNYPAFAAQMYTGDQGDAFQAHFSGVNPFFNITYQGTIRSNGGIALSTVINTASTLTLTAANKNVIANAASGPQTITLPSCYTPLLDRASPTGLEFTIVKSDASSNAVTLQTTNAQLIDSQGASATTLVLSSPSTQTLVCGPDYNWYVAGSANATVSGNAATATALAATPAQCPAGSYATGITANGTANCSQSSHFTWFGYFGGTFGTSTNTSLGAIWSPTAALNMTRLDIAVGTPPAGCTTYPVIGVYDSTASAWLKTVTLASGTYSYRNAASVSITAGHNLSMGVQTAGAGCGANAQNAQLTMEYTMNQ
ncbi:MAG: hypothetical protein WCC27_03165, partial [Acidobacteriaceae bacterium]